MGILELSLEPFDFELKADLERSIEETTASLVKDIAGSVPFDLQQAVGSSSSAKGSPPAKRTGFLQRSIKGYVVSPTAIEIEMADYAQYLDPYLGGSLDRPFIEESLERTLAKSLGDFG